MRHCIRLQREICLLSWTICDLLSLLSNHKNIVRFSPFTYHDIYKSGDYGNRDILNFEITQSRKQTKLQLVQFSLAQMNFYFLKFFPCRVLTKSRQMTWTLETWRNFLINFRDCFLIKHFFFFLSMSSTTKSFIFRHRKKRSVFNFRHVCAVWHSRNYLSRMCNIDAITWQLISHKWNILLLYIHVPVEISVSASILDMKSYTAIFCPVSICRITTTKKC